jgi:activator of HSP90 ATPase
MAIRQEIKIKGSPEAVYRALTTASEFGEFTGAPAEFSPEEGRSFSLFGGQITGRNTALVTNEKIVQAWRVKAWPEGLESTVSISLDAEGDGTKLTLDHTGYPEEAEGHLGPGWHKMYWEPLRKFVE